MASSRTGWKASAPFSLRRRHHRAASEALRPARADHLHAAVQRSEAARGIGEVSSSLTPGARPFTSCRWRPRRLRSQVGRSADEVTPIGVRGFAMRRRGAARNAPRTGSAPRSPQSTATAPRPRRPAPPPRSRWRPRRRARPACRRSRPGAGTAAGRASARRRRAAPRPATRSRSTSRMSATRQAIASSAARAMCAGRARRGQPGHHRPRLRTPPRRAEAGQRGQHADTAGVLHLGRGRPASAAGSAASPRSRESHSSSAPAVKTPPSSAHSTRPSPATRSWAAGRLRRPGRSAPDVREHEHARPVRGLRPAGLDAAGAGERRLLVRASGAQRAAPPATTGGAARRGRRPCRAIAGSASSGTPKISSSCGSQLGRARAACATRSPDRSRTRPRAGRRGMSRRCPSAACPLAGAVHGRRRARAARRACRPRSRGRAAGRCARAPRPPARRPRAGRAPPASACPAR